jgi:hypothetical protein
MLQRRDCDIWYTTGEVIICYIERDKIIQGID